MGDQYLLRSIEDFLGGEEGRGNEFMEEKGHVTNLRARFLQASGRSG